MEAMLLGVPDLKATHPRAADRPLPDDIELSIGRANRCVDPNEAAGLDAGAADPGMPAGELQKIRT